jgi:hypothetical protein
VRVVTRDEYERRKRRLEEQLRAGVELLQSAYQAQVRALDLVWMLQAEERGENVSWSAPAPSSQEPAPPPDRPRRRSAPEVEADVRAAFGRLPEAFTRRDVCEVLGYEPDRAALYRILQTLTQEGVARVESAGEGQRATVYRKTGGHDSPAQG